MTAPTGKVPELIESVEPELLEAPPRGEGLVEPGEDGTNVGCTVG